MKKRNVLITGAGSGIGRSVALKFAAEGADIIVVGRSEKKLTAVCREIDELGGSSLAVQADVSSDSDMKKAFVAVSERWDRIDVLFANAGINGMWAPIEDITVEEWDLTHDINMKGTFLTVKYAIPLMKEHGGAIVIDSSVNGTRVFANRGTSCYGSSKAAQAAFGKFAAVELARYRIRVNVVCPGATVTDIDDHMSERNIEDLTLWSEFPNGNPPLSQGEWANADQVADAVMYLAGEGASHITGVELHIDGGTSLIT
ncbi:MAG: SDR family oxidoreductase [Spirochaetales bacterium]|nr:SDR family oxidoreductase [Spirochaetales bacterium]